MKVLYGVCSLGLGHATRSLPIIRKLIDEGNEITVVSNKISLELLKMELGDTVNYLTLEDYPLPYTEKPRMFILKFGLWAPKLIKSIIAEHKSIVKYIEKNHFDIIISDNRYGIFHKNIPSFFISHQLRVIAPGRIRLLENSFERFNAYFQKYFQTIMVPDYEQSGISGDLSHNLKLFDSGKVKYCGIISDFYKTNATEDVDILISISGPEPQRQVLEDIMFSQVKEIGGNIIISMGRSLDGELEKKRNEVGENVKLYDFLSAEKRQEILNRSKLIVSRSGYSTLMDIHVLKKKAMFIPTPQQTEQEYLAKFHERLGNFHFVPQCEVDLKENIKKAQSFKGSNKDYHLKTNLDNFIDIIYS